MTPYLTVQSAPRFCAVCVGRRLVEVVWLVDAAVPASTVTPCPHCATVPIFNVPVRADQPRGAA